MSDNRDILSLANIKDLMRDTEKMIEEADASQKRIEKQREGMSYKSRASVSFSFFERAKFILVLM